MKHSIELCTLDDVLAHPDLRAVGEPDHDWLLRQIRRASSLIEGKCHREFLRAERTRDFDVDSRHQQTLQLPAFGSSVGAVLEVWASYEPGTFGAAELQAASGYVYDWRTGALFRKYLAWPCGPQTVRVRWNDGTALVTAQVPDDLRELAAMQVAFWWKQKSEVGVRSHSDPDSRAVTTLGSQKLLPEVCEALELGEWTVAGLG